MKLFLALVFAIAPLAGCQTQLGDGGAPVVDAAPRDAAPRPDARAAGARDGERCLVSPDDPSGGCAPGYACTIIAPGPAQCRQTCPDLNFSCTGYTGPGYSFCALTYSDDNGQPAGNLCLVVCGDDNMTLRGCDDGACNGNCPGDWGCQIDPNNFGLRSCQ